MAVIYRPAVWLPEVLRAAGCHVVEETGWRRRGLSRRLPFTPRNLVWHHDASAKGPSPGVPRFLIRHFQTGSAQCWVCLGCAGKHPVGTWHLIASGRAPHTGVTRPGVPTNFTSIGIETDHTVGEHWHPELLSSLRRGSAAILAHLKRPPGNALWFHKTICLPPGRKVDPDGLTQRLERRRVAALMPAELLHRVDLSNLRHAARGHPWSARHSTRLVQRALKAKGLIRGYIPGRYGKNTRRAYSRWQRRLGFTGADANGVPGKKSLTRLGKGRFTVRP